MFPLPVGSWPATVEQLREQMLEGLRPMMVSPPRLTVSGQWPVLSELALDLGGVPIDPSVPWPVPKPAVERRTGPGCRRLRVYAAPLKLGDIAQPHLDLLAVELQFELVRDEAGQHWLRPVAVGGGSIHARITGTELERLFLETARKLARAQGITVDEISINVKSAEPNNINLEAEIGARKMFLKGRLRFAGIAEFGSAFDIRLRDLRCEGVGAIGSIAARAVHPHLDRYGHQTFRPFGSLVSGLALEHFQLNHGEGGTLELEARIARAAQWGRI
jgi:hypothetical protein